MLAGSDSLDLSFQKCFSAEISTNHPKAFTAFKTNVSTQALRTEECELVAISDVQALADNYVARLICVTQNHSASRLNLTEQLATSIMNKHRFGTDLTYVFSLFYQKIIHEEESFCLPLQVYGTTDRTEYFYVLKYPERTEERADSSWTIRQSAIIHQYDATEERSVTILISPRPSMKGELAVINALKVWSQAQHAQSPFSCDLSLLKAYFGNWRSYIRAFDKGVEDLSLTMRFSGFGKDQYVVAKNMADLHGFESMLLPVETLITATSDMIDGLTATYKIHATHAAGLEDWNKYVDNHKMMTRAYKRFAQTALQKCASACQLLNGVVDYHNQSIARDQHAGVVFLTKSTVDDSATVRIITGITLVYLSFSAVAAIMAMPLFYLDSSRYLALSPSFWVYIALAVPLTGVTMGYWRWSLRQKRRERNGSPTRLEDAV